MATIELYKSKINNMPNTLSDLRSEIDSYNLELKSFSAKLLAVTNPILDKVISKISTASRSQEEQVNCLNEMLTKIDEFVAETQRIDNSVAEYIRGLRNFDVPSYGHMMFIYKGIKTDTLNEYLSKLSETNNRVKSYREKQYNDTYIVSDYIEYDYENDCYRIKDEQKLNELLTKESPSEVDLMKMRQLFALTVDDDGNIDTEFLEQLIKCSYKEQRHYSEGEIRHESDYIGDNPYNNTEIYDNNSRIPYEYYTTYTKSSNISSPKKSICASLSDDKYRDLRVILAALNDEIEGAHFHGKVSRDKLLFFFRIIDDNYKEYIKDKFAYIEKTNGTDIFGFDVNIETSDVFDSNYESKIKQYDITYSTSAKDEKKSDYPSYTVYQYADKNGFISDIFHDIHQDMNESDYNYVINAIENFRKDENMNYSGIEKGFGFWAVGKLAGKLTEKTEKTGVKVVEIMGKEVPVIDLMIDIASFADAYNDAVAQQEENKRNNAEIDNISQNLDRRKIVQAIESAATSEASLRGQLGNYIVKKDSSGIVTDIFVSNMTIDDSRFANEYKDFQQYKADHNETIPSDISHFDDLTPELQKEMIRWKLFP